MSRIHTPASVEAAPEASIELLNAVNGLLGFVPNMFRIISNSPAGLEGYLGLNGALAKGALGARNGERIALAVAEINGCDYCVAAHNYLGANVAKLSAEETSANRRGSSTDEKAAVAVRFATKVSASRGQVSDADVQAVRNAGYSDAEIVEIILHVALNTLTNLVNNVLETEIDFPAPNAKAA
jgi:uncharacterized peroxidase-related enzyme